MPAATVDIPDIPEPSTGNRVPVESFSRAAQIRLVVISSLLTLILTVFITLGILYNLNQSSLQFAAPRDIQQLSQHANDLDQKLSTLESDQTALSTRLDNLESMAGRLNELESISTETRDIVNSDATQVQVLTSQAVTLTRQIDSVSSQVETLNAQVDGLQSNYDRFQQFLDGLQTLLSNLLSEGK
jgi:chromosome segregation ATPase